MLLYVSHLVFKRVYWFRLIQKSEVWPSHSSLEKVCVVKVKNASRVKWLFAFIM